MMKRDRFVKPKVWNFELVKGEEAWKEVVYSARTSGVPPQVKDRDCFRMMVENDYGSVLEHIILKFDIRLSKGNAPEFLEHRMASHTGYSTRYIKVDEEIGKEEKAYEFIYPSHLIKNEKTREFIEQKLIDQVKAYEEMLKEGIPREISRYILPFAQAVGIYHVTMNLRSLLNLLSLRLCVRASPEFRCIAAQLYLNLVENLPEVRGLVGCRGYMRGCCPESNVTGVRVGKQHHLYPPCPFKSPESDIYIPTIKELRRGVNLQEFNLEEALQVMEKRYEKWARW